MLSLLRKSRVTRVMTGTTRNIINRRRISGVTWSDVRKKVPDNAGTLYIRTGKNGDVPPSASLLTALENHTATYTSRLVVIHADELNPIGKDAVGKHTSARVAEGQHLARMMRSAAFGANPNLGLKEKSLWSLAILENRTAVMDFSPRVDREHAAFVAAHLERIVTEQLKSGKTAEEAILACLQSMRYWDRELLMIANGCYKMDSRSLMTRLWEFIDAYFVSDMAGMHRVMRGGGTQGFRWLANHMVKYPEEAGYELIWRGLVFVIKVTVIFVLGQLLGMVLLAFGGAMMKAMVESM